jgi:lysophospholipase L1-like esterase
MERNHEALVALVALARHDGAKVLLYRQPHRPGEVPFYHNRAAYDAYYQRVAALADTSDGVYALDLETIVPAEYYGRTNSGRPDAFHFTDRGHRILAEHLSAFFAQQEGADRHAVQ